MRHNFFQYLEKVAEKLDRELEVMMEFEFEIPLTVFDKEDMKQWAEKNNESKKKKGGKFSKSKPQKHKKEVDYCQCDLLQWSKIID